MRIAIFSFLIIFASCTTAKLSVPANFSGQATKMPVKGINGWQVNQKLAFGNYSTSRIRRGWDFSGSVQYTKFRIRPEEALLKVFDINTERGINFQKNRLQYTIEDGSKMAEIYATEKFNEKQLVYKSNNPWIGNASKTSRYEYSFTAAIVPLMTKGAEPWSLVLINRYDIAKDTSRRFLDPPYVEEEGYATNGTDHFAIRPLRMDHVASNNGKNTKLVGGKMLAGYEVQRDGNAVAMIDILDNSIWMHNNLQAADKLILSAVCSAILLKRMQDVGKEKDDFVH